MSILSGLFNILCRWASTKRDGIHFPTPRFGEIFLKISVEFPFMFCENLLKHCLFLYFVIFYTGLEVFCWTENIIFLWGVLSYSNCPTVQILILANSNQFRNLLLLWFNPCGSTRSPQKKFCFSQSDGTAGLKMVFPAPRAFVAGKFLSFLSLIRDWLSINWKQSKTFGKLSQSCDDGKKCAAVIFTVVSQASKNSLAGKLQTCFLRTGQN